MGEYQKINASFLRDYGSSDLSGVIELSTEKQQSLSDGSYQNCGSRKLSACCAYASKSLIVVFLEGHRRREEAILDSCEALGVEVVYREEMHHKAAIIDRAIAWEGSLNILQHWNTQEQMTRHEDPEYIKQLMKVLEVK